MEEKTLAAEKGKLNEVVEECLEIKGLVMRHRNEKLEEKMVDGDKG